MNLSDIRDRLADVYGDISGAQDTFYNRIINDAYRKLCTMADWWWLTDTAVIRSNAPVTTFTADCTQGTAEVVITSSAANFTQRSWCKAPNRTYQIIANSPTNTLTLDANWIDATSSPVSLVCWKDTYALSTAVRFVKQVTCRNDPNFAPLRQVPPTEIESFGTDLSDYSTEFADRYAVIMDPDATGVNDNYMIRFFPPADETAEYMVEYQVAVSDIADDTATAIIPREYDPVLVDMARLELMVVEGEDPDRIQTMQQQVNMGLTVMRKEQSRRGGVHHRFKRRNYVDGQKVTRFKLKNTEGVTW